MTAMTLPAIASEDIGRPLVVDLDGTLLKSDLLVETAFSKIGGDPLSLIGILKALLKGKAALKHHLAEFAEFDPASLPYDHAVLARIQKARSCGRPVYLASASNQRLVGAVADYLGLFTGWFASNEKENLADDTKAARLVKEFGERGYDYIGNGSADLPVWAKAAQAIAVRTPRSVMRALPFQGGQVEHIETEQPSLRTWAKLFRVHQYAKNSLIFVPLLLSHQFSAPFLVRAILAAVAFSLCASSVYVLNDLVDLQADRQHPTKQNRPLASGAVPIIQGILSMPLLLALSIILASFVSIPFLGIMLGYFVLTTAYSLSLKKKMLIDVVVLAMLYVIRIVAGAVAVENVLSEWLLAFSMFLFLSLALIKRYTELTVRLDSGLANPANRNYKVGDLEVVAALAAAAGFNAVTVFALYISSDAVHILYHRPQLLWLICPILIYWISRALMMAHRRHMDDDPILFALRDKNSILAGVIVFLLVVAAI
jgi:4-hydroxybenzoate polyprenyltransferase/phosphoserine phosphatase